MKGIALADTGNAPYLLLMAARIWHKAPFIRLLVALASGILVQWHTSFSVTSLLISLAASLLLLLAISFTGIVTRYRLRTLSGLLLFSLLFLTGCLLVWMHDVRNHPGWIGHHNVPGRYVTVVVQEPLVEKPNSFKTLVSVDAIYHHKEKKVATGTIILYFKKDSLLPPLPYGSRLLTALPLQAIQNAGNPGSFDYKTYNLFQGITHQAFLTRHDFVLLPHLDASPFQSFIYNSRLWVVTLLKTFIEGEKESGVAEALLIGYKDDLDKTLVQAYSNTGVVHIIAISGLHLGLIYAILLLLTRPMKKIKKGLLPRLLIILCSLWLFSILAGAGPSVLRSALMFTLIAIGESSFKKTNIFNTLSFSAFGLLCFNPFWLWDVGFQLSYAAVLSIVLFFRPAYALLHFPNRGIDFLWKLTAVTIAAQVLTLPISIYHFHQMPLLFLVTNFVAVPLSSLILIGEIMLCVFSFWPFFASFLGSLLSGAIRFMNSYIEGLDRLPFVTWNLLSITMLQTILLALFSVSFCYWLMEKQRRYAWTAFTLFAFFMILRGVSFYEAYRQKKLIVYNVPKHPAIDVIIGRNYYFLGDSLLRQNGFQRNFHLQPSRILHRVSPQPEAISTYFTLGGKRLLLLDKALSFAQAIPKQKIDVLILSKNPKIYISKLLQSFRLGQVVIDGSVPPWKAALWQKDCDSLQVPCYNVSEKGAYVLNW